MPLRIAFYCPNKPLGHPEPSGDQVIASGIRQALIRRGHDCREVCTFRSRWFWKSLSGCLKVPGGWMEALGNALGFHPDLWLTYHTYYKSPDLIGPCLTRLLSIPYVLFQPMYGTRRRKTPGTRTGFYLNRGALKAAAHAFTNNMDDLEALRRILPENAVTYLPPGIFPEDFEHDAQAGAQVRRRLGIAPEAPLLMSAARMRSDVKFQSLTYLLHSLHLLLESPARKTGFKLLLVGDGPKEGELRAMAADLLPGRVVFAGRVERSHMHRYYSAADLFVFPGIGESLGMVFLEAQACGLPVVALDTAGIPQVVKQGVTGLLAPKDGGRALAEAVADLLAHPEKRLCMAAQGPLFISRERNLHKNYNRLSRALEDIARSASLR